MAYFNQSKYLRDLNDSTRHWERTFAEKQLMKAERARKERRKTLILFFVAYGGLIIALLLDSWLTRW